ncbi:concanavalin A-like lectin/glucanase [Hypoxylon trugodes]|uniref:concanavalin A-like lectin/glucanase n=1 Tax=Hypoxylon trugodes TaxID=326681 RepID=UPI002191A8C5|nr:concanavalin A-like lectin/glucanase [Hypoxylon trugodes]KAI1386817.1 concanavalin A-like lectin/glucanase [Hypoxylon trugodes]
MKFSTYSALAATLFTPATSAAFDQNRGGAVLKAPEDSSFTSAAGTFTVPTLTGSNKLSIWVAIGDTLQQDIVLKGGITYSNGLTSFAAWYPDKEIDITSDIPISAGDSVTITVSVPADDKSNGTVIVENTTQNKKSTQIIPVPAKADPATLTSLAADWFVQAYQEAGELVQVPQFDSISFTKASATLANGTTIGPDGAGVFEIQGTSGQIYSSTTVTADGITVRQQQQ